jgi:hypothetical protein
MKTQQEVCIMTEDNAVVHPGDRVYNYYDMWPGTIQPLSDYDVNAALGSGVNIKNDIWFTVAPDDGGQRALLNGARICTIAFARQRGFRGAA